MKFRFELNEKDLINLVADYLESRSPFAVNANQIKIEVKSKQNYKSEWEQAAFRAVYEE